jgi:hypothetical protein
VIESGAVALPLSRARFVGLSAAAAAGIALRPARAAASPVADVTSFASRPDIVAPTLAVATPARGTAAGLVFAAASAGPGRRGPQIVDDAGELVWFRPLAKATAMNLRVQRWDGVPVLTWWEGAVTGGYGAGEYVIADSSYRVQKRIRAGNGYAADLHELQLTEEGTALLTIYAVQPADLRAVGGPTDGRLLESIVQEVDLASGRVLLEWRARDHVALEESFAAVTADPFDHFHVNSIDVDRDGHLLVSARNTWAVYKLDRKTGAVIWRLGGKRSNLALAQGAQFFWQHDARRQPDGTITLFDDGAAPVEEAYSRGIRLLVDPRAATARRIELKQQFAHPDARLAVAMGSMQPLDDGGAFVGWGTVGSMSEFAPDGSLRFDARFAGGGVSYRSYRTQWSGRPASPPALGVVGRRGRAVTVHASWNGATGVGSWRLLAGPAKRSLRPVAVARRTGFETTFAHRLDEAYVAVAALDARGRELGRSVAYRLP